MRFGCPSMLLLALLAAANIEWNSASEEVYATLLYGDEFLLGVRVLGKSIRDTGATRDMVVLVSDGVSDYGKRLLQVRYFYLFASEYLLPIFIRFLLIYSSRSFSLTAGS